MAVFDWQTAENKLAQLVALAAGLPVGKVFWEGQSKDRPALPYVTLRRDGEECLSFAPEQIVSDNEAGHPGVVSGTDTITPALDPATPQASVTVGHLAQWGEAGTSGTCTLEPGTAREEVVAFAVGAAGLALTPWPSKAHDAGAAVARAAVIGTELLIDYRVDTEFHLRVQVFTAEVRGNAAAPALLSRLHAYFDTDSAGEALAVAGLVCVERGTVLNLSGLVETKIEGRAALDIRLRTGDGGQETATYIGSVEITPTLNDVEGAPFTVDSEE